MRIIFDPDGAVHFEGGFANYKTAHWDYDTAIEDLTLTVPELEKPEKTTHIPMGPNTESFEFLGWVFFRAPAAQAKP